MGHRADLECEGNQDAVRRVRAFVADQLLSWGAEDLADAARLCTSELATNALLHARSPFRLAMTMEPPELLVTVHDDSPAPPKLTQAPDDATYGRGLRLVQAMAADWGWQPTNAGKAVWFRLKQQDIAL